jgi:hypothetical protein
MSVSLIILVGLIYLYVAVDLSRVSKDDRVDDLLHAHFATLVL